jgi:hypothetical protein
MGDQSAAQQIFRAAKKSGGQQPAKQQPKAAVV